MCSLFFLEQTFVDGDSVGDTISGVKDDTSGTTGSVERQDGLDGDIHGRAVEGLKHDLQRGNKSLVKNNRKLSEFISSECIPGSFSRG